MDGCTRINKQAPDGPKVVVGGRRRSIVCLAVVMVAQRIAFGRTQTQRRHDSASLITLRLAATTTASQYVLVQQGQHHAVIRRGG